MTEANTPTNEELRSNLDLDESELAYPEVSKGVAWMDEHEPGWAGKIDPNTLSIKSRYHCVVCQVTGLYWGNGVNLLEYRHRGMDLSAQGFRVPDQHLFEVTDSDWCQSADRLWKAAAAARVAAK